MVYDPKVHRFKAQIHGFRTLRLVQCPKLQSFSVLCILFHTPEFHDIPEIQCHSAMTFTVLSAAIHCYIAPRFTLRSMRFTAPGIPCFTVLGSTVNDPDVDGLTASNLTVFTAK